jgi:hypothetical protein
MLLNAAQWGGQIMAVASKSCAEKFNQHIARPVDPGYSPNQLIEAIVSSGRSHP